MGTTGNPESGEETTASSERVEPDWNALVEQFQPLINSVCRRFGLRPEDAADVSQDVWLRVFAKLHTLRDPLALPGWIKTITINASCAMLRNRGRVVLAGDLFAADDPRWAALTSSTEEEVDARLLREERRTAVRSGLEELPEHSRTFVGMLVADPPIHYEQISIQLHMPMGSIGPTRARCLAKLAKSAPVLALTATAA